MSAQVETLGAEENLMDVAQRMSDSPHRAFPVIDDDMNVVGLLSRRDVLKALTSGAWFKA
jgi:CBS domain-containing protein